MTHVHLPADVRRTLEATADEYPLLSPDDAAELTDEEAEAEAAADAAAQTPLWVAFNLNSAAALRRKIGHAADGTA